MLVTSKTAGRATSVLFLRKIHTNGLCSAGASASQRAERGSASRRAVTTIYAASARLRVINGDDRCFACSGEIVKLIFVKRASSRVHGHTADNVCRTSRFSFGESFAAHVRCSIEENICNFFGRAATSCGSLPGKPNPRRRIHRINPSICDAKMSRKFRGI